MGRGDKKTKKGKIWKGSFGNSRKRKSSKVTSAKGSADAAGEAKPKVKKAPKKRAKTV